MFDNSTTPAFERSEFDALVRDLRERATQQDAVTKAEAAGRTADAVMARAAELFAVGHITGAELTRLHAVRLRLEAQLPLPGGRG